MRITLSILTVCLAASSAMAQQALDPVDQAVGDLDPHSASLRLVQPGLSNEARIYRQPGADALGPGLGRPMLDGATGLRMQQQYRYSAPGVRAWMQRPDYLVRSGAQGLAHNVTPSRDGEFLARIPAGTVFDLVPRPGAAPADLLSQALRAGDPNAMHAPVAEAEPWTDLRTGGRLDTRVDGRVGARYVPQAAASLEAEGELGEAGTQASPSERHVPRVPQVLRLRRVQNAPERSDEE